MLRLRQLAQKRVPCSPRTRLEHPAGEDWQQGFAHLRSKFTSKGSENPPLKNGRMELARPKTDIKLGRRVWSLPKPKLAEHGDDLDPVAALKFQVKRYLLRATHLVLPLHSMKSSLNLSGDSSCVVAMDVSHASNGFGALGFV